MDMWGEIGTAAGAVYTALTGFKKPTPITEVKRKTKLSEHVLFMAVGWLAREGKVKVEQETNKTVLSIK